MPTYRYRAATAAGALSAGQVEGVSSVQVIDQLRRSGLTPIDVVQTSASAPRADGRLRTDAASRRAMTGAIGELAVLLGAGLTLDRALSISAENIVRPGEKAAFVALQNRVKEGAPLSRAMMEAPGLFPPMASAMAEAGEANGRLDAALARLAETLERTEALRQVVVSAMIYPALLLVIATAVILTMLLWVVPQFEGLFSDAGANLPFMTRLIMQVSHAVRVYGAAGVFIGGVGVTLLARWLRGPSMRETFDRWVLGLPQFGALATTSQLGLFARVLSNLVEGGVPLPEALAIARRSLSNSHLSAAMGRVVAGVKQGAALTASLSAESVFPRGALSFIRTGEETAQLGLMLGRLADVLDRDLRRRVDALIAVLTPLITVLMGAIVASVIASIMTAILGFNDLALTQ
ncbi:type II secretion system F family protein [Phenylobacterium sp.]|uniref:type II secretion system F family protein n=1 Tax=Phenylobacterium sp. TaxID=1871053 RepID=UPI00122230E4|nr:type II secretion system F family protein [Phenylobacterium sp.]THD60618.1 MAG: type II secretion system F family protein [Phenylobacterium sp.]